MSIDRKIKWQMDSYPLCIRVPPLPRDLMEAKIGCFITFCLTKILCEDNICQLVGSFAMYSQYINIFLHFIAFILVESRIQVDHCSRKQANFCMNHKTMLSIATRKSGQLPMFLEIENSKVSCNFNSSNAMHCSVVKFIMWLILIFRFNASSTWGRNSRHLQN